MEREEALGLLRGGPEGVAEWNRLREDIDFEVPDLRNADLRGAFLPGAILRRSSLVGANLDEANLHGANLREADLRGAFLRRANLDVATLVEADLRKADLRKAILLGSALRRANLVGANLDEANLPGADLREADLRGAILPRANLGETNLRNSDLRKADLHGAILLRANLVEANLVEANLCEANLRWANAAGTVFDTELGGALGLDEMTHQGPSALSQRAQRSLGTAHPKEFLRGCGLTPWEVLSVRLHDPTLSPEEIVDLQANIFALRTDNPIQVRPIFISYTHKDAEGEPNFVDRMQSALHDAGINTWRDIHDSVAGDLEKQVADAMKSRLVVIVLSEASTSSDWVEHEVESARDVAKEQNRDVLVPLSLDGSWKTCDWPQRLRRQVEKFNILDFSEWEDREQFDRQFRRLAAGIRKWY